jgi:thiamine kinase-like enzyme
MTDPGAIVDLLEADLGPAAGPPQPLQGGITNRNFRVRFGDRECVLRIPGRETNLLGIDRRAERLACEEAARLGIGPALLAAGDGYLVTEFLAAEPIDGELLRADPSSAARALRAFHDSGIELPARFWVPDLLGDYQRIVSERGGALPADYDRVRALTARIAQAMPLADPSPCHDDLLPANILALRSAPGDALLVDWEYAGMGHPMFDLGNLAVNNELDERSQELLLQAYFDAPPTDRQRAELQLMRIMSDAREAAWGVVQGAISELDFDFTDYAETHFGRLQRSASDPRLEDWLSAATA